MGWIFDLYQNDDDEYTFALIDGADVTMLQGAGYVQEANAMKSIDLIRTNAGCDACYEPSVDSDSQFYFYFTTPDRKAIAISETFDSQRGACCRHGAGQGTRAWGSGCGAVVPDLAGPWVRSTHPCQEQISR